MCCDVSFESEARAIHSCRIGCFFFRLDTRQTAITCQPSHKKPSSWATIFIFSSFSQSTKADVGCRELWKTFGRRKWALSGAFIRKAQFSHLVLFGTAFCFQFSLFTFLTFKVIWFTGPSGVWLMCTSTPATSYIL